MYTASLFRNYIMEIILMLKKAKIPVALIALALTFALPQIGWSMDPENESQQSRLIAAINEKNAYKMFLFCQNLKDATTGEILPLLSKDVQGVIGGILYEASKYPVLEGELIYTSDYNGQQFTYKINDLVKEWTLELSNEVIFGDIANYLVITTDLTKFLKIGGENKDRTVMLIAPWFLIEENLNSTAKSLKYIMTTWNKEAYPIGIFWRYGNWDNLEWCDYLTNQNVDIISEKNFYELWLNCCTTVCLPFPICMDSFTLGISYSCFVFKPKKDLMAIIQAYNLGAQYQAGKSTEQKSRNADFEDFNSCRLS